MSYNDCWDQQRAGDEHRVMKESGCNQFEAHWALHIAHTVTAAVEYARKTGHTERGPHREGLSAERCGCSACERSWDIQTRGTALIKCVKTYTPPAAQEYLAYAIFEAARRVQLPGSPPLSWIKFNPHDEDMLATSTLAMAALTSFEETDAAQPAIEVGLFMRAHSDEGKTRCAMIRSWLLAMNTAPTRCLFKAEATYTLPPPSDEPPETMGVAWFKRQRQGRHHIIFMIGKCTRDHRFLQLALDHLAKNAHVFIISDQSLSTMLPNLDPAKCTRY